jgi:ribose transport system permease protein
MAETITNPTPPEPTEVKQPSGLQNRLRRILSIPEVGVFIPLIGFVILFYSINPHFLNPRNVAAMARALSFVGVIAIGQVFLMISGEFDLSVGSTAGLAAIVCSYLMVNMGWGITPAILGGLAAGALVGFANAFITLVMGVPAFITTLGMLYIARGLNYLLSKGYTIYPLPDSLKVFGTAQPWGISWSFFIFIGLALIADQFLRRTVHGRKRYAVGGNPEVANLAGISVKWIKTIGFVLTGMCAAFAGMLLMARLVTGQPTIGLGWELNVIAAVVIGGTSLWGGSGTILGAVLGLMIMQAVTNGLIVINVDPYWQTVAIGLIMIIAVYVDLLRRKAKTSSS